MPRIRNDPANPDTTRAVLVSSGLQPNKLLGQSFLVHAPTLDSIVEASGVGSSDSVLEVGPGLGALTCRLVTVAREVTAVEKDAGLTNYLKEHFASPNLRLLHDDALTVSWADLGLPETGVHFVANLPYSISKPMLRRLMEPWRRHLKAATVTVQKEVAQRLVAQAGARDYGPMALMAQLLGRATVLFDIPPSMFYPPPSVTSTVVRIEMLPEPSLHLEDERLFWTLVRAGFGQRRKQLGNTLRSVVGDRNQLSHVLGTIDPQRRAETLSLEEFADVANALARLRKESPT